jgi:type II secretory pathway pseudopilin PulG
MRLNQKFANKAFTLIELMVSIGIIIALTIVFMTNYHFVNSRTDVIMVAQKLVADIHSTQNDALGLAKYNGYLPAGGWGLSFSTAKNSYTLFADLNAPGNSGYMQYDPSPSGEGVVKYGARVTTLPPGITISNLKTDQNSSTTAVNLTFLPPDPQTNIYDVGSAATSTTLLITLKEAQNGSTKIIRVNFLGLAEVTN